MMRAAQHTIALIFAALCLSLASVAFASGTDTIVLQKAHVDLANKASLQRGAKWFMNYCSGCHSLQYMRYKRMARDLGIVDEDGRVAAKLVKDNLIFTGAKLGEQVTIAMPRSDAREWFGVSAPDLTLEARVRGSDWVYTYLKSFYVDDARPWGSNNLLFPDVAMPNVLAGLQGEVIPIIRTTTIPYDGGSKVIEVIDHLQLLHEGDMSEHQFDTMVHDIVNFLTYTAEPVKLQRQSLGILVILFLLVFLLLAYLLKQEYWKDVR